MGGVRGWDNCASKSTFYITFLLTSYRVTILTANLPINGWMCALHAEKLRVFISWRAALSEGRGVCVHACMHIYLS